MNFYFYDSQIVPQHKFDTCTVEVLNKDTLDGAIELKNNGYNPCLLNMCNSKKRGGELDTVGSQEEDLLRRGNYLDHLNNVNYPLPKLGLVYSKKVMFNKKGRRDKYTPIHPVYIDVIACAAIPNVHQGTRIMPPNDHIMKLKIESIFQVAFKNNHDSIVLSAFGCGGFRNPPEHVSLLFEKAIKRWKHSFRLIRFCIFDDNHHKSNYDIFKNKFV